MSEDKQPQQSNPQAPEEGIAARIKDKRKELDLTVEEMSALTAKYDYSNNRGVSSASIFRYEKGGPDGSLPGAREICLLCEALKVSPNWLLLGEDSDPKAKVDAELANTARSLVALVISGERWSPELGAGLWKDLEHSKKVSEVKESREKSNK